MLALVKHPRKEVLSRYFYLLAIAAQPVIAIIFWSRTWDDSAITLGFARTFALGGKIEPTVGSGIVEGYSTTLWMLVMTMVARISSDPNFLLDVAKGSTILLNMLNVVLVKKFVERFQSAALAALVAGVFGLQNITIYESINGMEGPLMLALFLAVLVSMRRSGSRYTAVFCTAGAFFILTRWEAAWFLVPVILLERPVRTAVQAAAIWSIAFFGSNWLRFRYFGSVLPNTVIAKSGPPYSHISPKGEFLRHIGALTQAGRALFPLLLILGVLAAFNMDSIPWSRLSSLLRDGKALASLLKSRFDLSLCLSVAFFGALLAAAIGINWGPANRSLFVVWPILLYLILFAAWKLAGWSTLQWQFSLVVIVSSIANLAVLTSQLARPDAPVYMPYTTVDNIRRLVPALEKLRKAASRPDLLFAGPDMGGLILFANHIRVIDTGMLLDPTLAHVRYRGVGHYIFDERHPDVIESHLLWTEGDDLLDEERLYRQYAIVYVQDVRFFVTRSLLSEIPQSELGHSAFDAYGRRSDEQNAGGDLTIDNRVNQRFRTYSFLK